MGIITANINFLSSLGITTSEQFMEAFGDMATFTEYCNDMGYSWTIDEEDNLILITPDGKEVDSYVQLEVTETPTITVTEGNTEYTIEATGDGEVKLYIDGVEVTNPIAIQRTSQSQEITITATAEEEGKVISETAEEEITIPALNTTAAPDIDMITGDDSCHIIATGDGTVKLYLEGTEVQNPYIVARGNSDQTLTFTATAQESGKQISDTTEEEFVIPALPITATPTINVTTGLASFEIEAVGNGTVLLYADGTAVSNPYTVNKTSTAQTIVFTATAQETHKQISATATQSVTIPAQEVTATPVITYDSLSYTVSVSGQGTVLAYVDGVQTQMPHTFTQTTSAVTYVVTATAQEQGKAISATATQNCVVPAATVVPNYMKLSVLNEPGNSGNITISIPSQVDSTQATSMSYSMDGINWTTTAVDNTDQTITIAVQPGDEVYLKGIANGWGRSLSNYSTSIVSIRAKYTASGNIMSLLYGDNFENQTTLPRAYAFTALFKSKTSNINKLTDASQLELPATNLTTYCYRWMFEDCTQLTTSPVLPAVILTSSCYSCMFEGCSSLNSITMLATNISTSNCLTDWVSGVAASGTFTKSPNMTTLPTGDSGIPTGWTVVDYVDPLTLSQQISSILGQDVEIINDMSEQDALDAALDILGTNE